jgi:predicted kinase
MSKVYFLIGVPGVGKSTWVAKQPFDWNKTVIASTDNYIERHASSQGKTYNDVFGDTIKDAGKHLNKTVQDAIDSNLDIIWDQTNVTVNSRKRKIAMIPANYEKIAIVFLPPEMAELYRRLKNRPGKTIPQRVLLQMLDDFQIPTKDEGFDDIKIIDSSDLF